LLHNCLPDTKAADVSIATECAGLRLDHPVIINAMTGGAVALTQVNERLAEIAVRTGSVMAVGSQYAAIESPLLVESFRIVRRVNPSGLIWANIGAYATVDEAQQAVEMIEANALQVHLNAAQEVSMSEGDDDFTGWLLRIEQMVRGISVPVIVKETGCGMAGEQIRQLASLGVAAIDVGGAGGTNFIAIELSRTESKLAKEMVSWGIPSAISAVEAAEALPAGVDLIVSGGIRSSLDAVKSFALGATAVGLAAPLLRLSEEQGVDAAVAGLEDYLESIKKCLLLLGHSCLEELRDQPLIITGEVGRWLELRGISAARYARRIRGAKL
jgi:isopentenyl-diphosphate delta-isomerase